MKNTTQIRDDILDALLPAVAFDGWTMDAARAAAAQAGYEPDMADAVFPGGADDIVGHFADRADREMLAALGDGNHLKIRERIGAAVRARITWLNRHKEAEREAVAYWMRPLRKYKGAKIVWRTADRIWDWAGDTATDYNRYTKRGLLSGVIAATTVYWLRDDARTLDNTFSFLDRRIENVLQLGKVMGNFKKAKA